MMHKLRQKMIQAINDKGILLVFPIKNKKEPVSLWSVLYPKSEMVWEWNEDSDGRISKLWVDRENLSRSLEVVYTKWYQGRATFFSKQVFILMLSYLKSCSSQNHLPAPSKQVLEELNDESPLSTKKIKANLEWQGKLMELYYNRAMKPLWVGLHITGFGEEHDSSFPSLNMASTRSLFEEEWEASTKITADSAYKELQKRLGKDSLFLSYADKIKKKILIQGA